MAALLDRTLPSRGEQCQYFIKHLLPCFIDMICYIWGEKIVVTKLKIVLRCFIEEAKSV